MTSFRTYLTATAVLGAVCAPAAAQTAYPYGYQQATPYGYQQPSPYGYQQQQAYPGYGYNQGYGYSQSTGNPVTDIIDSLLGNRYNVTDRQAVRQCTNAVRAQAAQQYGGHNNGYQQQGYGASNLRVTSITDVQRRGNGLRVSGTLGSAAGQYGYHNGYANGYQDRAYSAASLSFRCNVAYNGAVTGIRIRGY